MNKKRLAVVLYGIVLSVVIGVMALRFIAPLTISVFLYYSTRKFYKKLGKFPLPPRIRAATVLASLAVPLIILVIYSFILLLVEFRQFVNKYRFIEVKTKSVDWFGGINTIPEISIQGIYQSYVSGELDLFVNYASENAVFLTNLVSELALNMFVMVVVTYYLLVDGHRIRKWLVRFDDGAIIREYLEAADQELESVLFGNLLNIIATSLIAIIVFHAYNTFVPTLVEVPYPTLAGTLTGIASLIPLIGMKIIYLPLAGSASLSVISHGEFSLISYILMFIVLSLVFVDIVPDILLRTLLSGDSTHVGLLMLSYTLGPVVLGFYGLFFAPIILVLGYTFADTALPRLLNEGRSSYLE